MPAAGGKPARLSRVGMDRLDKGSQLPLVQQPWLGRPQAVRAGINDPDPVVGVQDRDRVPRPYIQPPAQWSRVSGEDGMKNQRWKRKIIDQVHVARDLDLLREMTMDLEQYGRPLLVAVLLGRGFYQISRLAPARHDQRGIPNRRSPDGG